MSDWTAALVEATRDAAVCVLVTIAATRGSVPRDAGTRMIVTSAGVVGTIGGGHLEFRALAVARELLSAGDSGSCRFERFTLGASLGQCCGGAVQLLFERIDGTSRVWVDGLAALVGTQRTAVSVTELVEPVGGGDACARRTLFSREGGAGAQFGAPLHGDALTRARAMLAAPQGPCVHFESPLLFDRIAPAPLHVALFGAGHVGRAVVGMLGLLPCRVTWIDPREAEFPIQRPGNVRVVCDEEPEAEVDALPASTHVLVMTHDHALDERVCARVLQRADLPWCGLIGSLPKRRRFARRLLARGLPARSLDRLHCPIGLDGIDGKHPGEIAVSVCAQILGARGLAERSVPTGMEAGKEAGMDTNTYTRTADPRTVATAESR